MLDTKKVIDCLSDNAKNLLNRAIDVAYEDGVKHNVTILPKKENVLKAFDLKNVRVVIIGQDPYDSFKELATGLAFAVNPYIQKSGKTYCPPSLARIGKSLLIEYPNSHFELPYDLECWKDQDVLLLNTALTVRKEIPTSHVNIWQNVLPVILKEIEELYYPIYLIWGNHAETFFNISLPYVTKDRVHFTCHPIARTKDFKPGFLWVNSILEKPIDWSIGVKKKETEQN